MPISKVPSSMSTLFWSKPIPSVKPKLPQPKTKQKKKKSQKMLQLTVHQSELRLTPQINTYRQLINNILRQNNSSQQDTNKIYKWSIAITLPIYENRKQRDQRNKARPVITIRPSCKAREVSCAKMKFLVWIWVERNLPFVSNLTGWEEDTERSEKDEPDRKEIWRSDGWDKYLWASVYI